MYLRRRDNMQHTAHNATQHTTYNMRAAPPMRDCFGFLDALATRNIPLATRNIVPRRGKPALRSGLATSELRYSARAHVGAHWQHAKILDSELSIAKANEVFMLANFEEEKADQWGDWVPNRHRRPARRRAVARGRPGAMPRWAARRRAVTLPAGARWPQDWDMTEKEFLEALVRLCSAREAAWADVADLAAKFELFVHDVLELLIAGRCRRVRGRRLCVELAAANARR